MEPRTFLELVRDGDVDAVTQAARQQPELLRAQGQAEWKDPVLEHGTALHIAAFVGNAAMEKALVAAGADVDATNVENRTALHTALEYNNTTRDQLLALGATLDVSAAAALQNLDRLGELLDEDPQRANDRSTGLSPLGWATYFGARRSAEELIRRGARMDDGELLCAAQTNGVAMGRLLLSHGIDPDAPFNEEGETALHAAAAMRYTSDSTPFIRMLLEAGARTDVTSSKGHRPVDYARMLLERQREQGIERDHDAWRNFEGAIELLETAA